MPPPRPIPPPLPPLPPLRRPALPLPPYRYVPGLSPHPFRHPEGHMFIGGAPPPTDPTQREELWLRGLDLFDHRFYWEAHEAWEGCWHHTPPGPLRTLQQALIQAAAALLKQHLGHHGAAQRLHAAAQGRLEAVIQQAGPILAGLDLQATRAALAAAAVAEEETAARWPRTVAG